MTIMDDTTFQAEMMKENKAFDNGPWDGYYYHALATDDQPIPGSVEFFKYAASKVYPYSILRIAIGIRWMKQLLKLKHWGLPNLQMLRMCK